MMYITLVIQIQPFGDKDTRIKVYETLGGWRKACMSMSNLVMLHRLTQEHVADMVYLADGIKARLSEKGEHALLNTSHQNATYRILSRHDVPSDIMNCINQRACKEYERIKHKVFKGECRVPYYQNNSPIPFSKESIRFFAEKGNKERLYKFRLFKHEFLCVLGKDKAGYRYRLNDIMEENIRFGNPSLFLNKRKQKWFLLLPIPVDQAKPDINPSLVCHTLLTEKVPIKAQFGSEEVLIGKQEQLAYRRRQMSERLRRLQENCRFSRGGKGRDQRLGALDRFHEKEKRFVTDMLHKYAAALVGQCIRRGYGTLTIQKEEPVDKGTEGNEYRYWSPAQLAELIQYKAQLRGIKVHIQ